MTTPVTTPEALADLALVPPIINTDPPARYQPDQQDYGMTIGIERTPGGRMWAAWVGGGDNEKAFMALATSDDDGVTWSPVRMVIDPHDPKLPLARRSIVANLWLDPLGRLWFFFDQAMTYYDGRAGTWCTRCDNPDSDQPAWTAPRRLWHGCSLNKPIVLRNGDWLLPVSLWDRPKNFGPFKDCFHELDVFRGANALVSTDAGETWTRRGGTTFPHPDFDEHCFIERADGSIWMTARTMDLNVWESVSTDAGYTWSSPNESTIKNVNSRHLMRRLASGRILLVKNGPRADQRTPADRPYAGRSHLTAFLSEDEGRTWIGGLTFDEREPLTYPDGFQSPDGAIYVSYDHQREALGQVMFAKFREADILAGKLVSPDAKVKQMIYEPRIKR